MKKEWITPEISDLDLSKTMNSNQPQMPSDDLWYDYYTECDTICAS